MMKKIKKQPPVTPETPVTSVSRVRYVLWYELHSSYLKTTEKMKNSHPQVQQVRPVGQEPRTLDTMIRQELVRAPCRPVGRLGTRLQSYPLRAKPLGM